MSYSPTQPGMDTSGVGASNVQALTLFDSMPFEPPYGVEAADPGGMAGAVGAAMATNGNPQFSLIGLIVMLVILGFVREQSKHLQSVGIAYNAFNFLTMTLVTITGIVIAKVVFTKFKVPGITPLVQAV